jgi:hypothetical protein
VNWTAASYLTTSRRLSHVRRCNWHSFRQAAAVSWGESPELEVLDGMAFQEFHSALDRCGGRNEPIGRRERHNLLQAWREVYAAPYHDAKGRWKLSQFEWHVFSFGYARALNGARAMAAYSDERSASLIVCPEDGRLPASKIIQGVLPEFREWRGDVYVWPIDLSWTMAFTHEESIGLGPYFSRMEWASACRTGSARRRRK